MTHHRNDTWRAPEPFLWNLVRSNVPVLLFLALALGGMMTVYWFFSPPDEGGAEAFSASGAEDLLMAAIYKQVPARPVVQRVAQSMGPLRIGLIAGHREHDAGAVCADGLTEAEVNLRIAEQVVNRLQQNGIPVEILAEFDPRLQNYSGTALVSIHADSCEYVNEQATGFKISGSSITDSSQLSACVEAAYAAATGLPFHAHTITDDMRDYHAFREIAPGVPALIIEVGFLNRDRELLTSNADVPAEGIAKGILCYLENRHDG